MKKTNINLKKGFTIIEVVLVLAIAGLVFLMVFVALPNLQRSQRDTQRRDDFADLSANIEAFVTNNGGKLPADGSHLSSNIYINEKGTDPNGEYYIIDVQEMTNVAWNEANNVNNKTHGAGTAYLQSTETDPADTDSFSPDGNNQVAVATTDAKDGTYVYVITHANCNGTSTSDGSAIPEYDSGNRRFVVYGDLEGGTYCEAH